MRKKAISAFLISAVMLLSAVRAISASDTGGWEIMADEKKTGSVPQISYEEYPHFDGSLACVPLIEKLASKITGCTEEQAEGVLSDFSNTNPCYSYLAKGERDIVIAYEPARETVDQIENWNDLVLEPVGKDGLVFIVNKDNPVESLSAQQLYDIYTGKISNWKEVGGSDEKIAVFRRPEQSGSQTLMRKLLMGDADMEIGESEEISSMEGIITRLKDYDNSSNAIGYSVYYYASAMFDQPDLKFLKVDGTAPSEETIGSGAYPFVNEFYCVVRKDSPKDAINIKNWLCRKEGQDFIKECGYVPVGSKE